MTNERANTETTSSIVGLSRRRFLALSATLAAAACSSDGDADAPATTPRADSASSAAGTTIETTSATTTTQAPATTASATTEAATEQVEFSSDPFVFGVASGDPDTESVVLWTRLGGELPDGEIPVLWVFTGDSGNEVTGSTTTDATIGHSVHVIASIDEPGTFTFSSGEFVSPTGTTAPIDPETTEFRIASASCQHYETGFYAAHRDIAEWGPDLVVFLGDFMYEGDANEIAGPFLRSHEGAEPTDLEGYRDRYATYLGDPDLQASRAAAPWLSIWDDHEVENNYAGMVPQDTAEQADFADRRAQAYQVWWENTPTRLDPPSSTTNADEPFVIHRGIDVGELVRISALDGRQYRSDQVSDATLDPGPPADGWDDPERTMLGDEQEDWVADRFTTSTAVWNCLAQQTVLGDTRLGDVGAILNYDQWDGYHPARERLLENAPSNLITLTGDIHLAGVGVLGPIGAPVGIEFVTTAISSVANVDPELADVVLSLPALVDADLVSRGYTRHTVTPDAWTAVYRQVADIADAESSVGTWKTFRVDAGTPAVTEA